jgi:hypothetical protein
MCTHLRLAKIPHGIIPESFLGVAALGCEKPPAGKHRPNGWRFPTDKVRDRLILDDGFPVSERAGQVIHSQKNQIQKSSF